MKNKLNKVVAVTCVCIGMTVNCFASGMHEISENSSVKTNESELINTYAEKSGNVIVNAIPDTQTGALHVSGRFPKQTIGDFTLLILIQKSESHIEK